MKMLPFSLAICPAFVALVALGVTSYGWPPFLAASSIVMLCALPAAASPETEEATRGKATALVAATLWSVAVVALVRAAQ